MRPVAPMTLLSSAWPLTKITLAAGSTPLRPVSWWALAYIGMIAGPLGTWCVTQATASLPAPVSSLGSLATPAVSRILANVFLQEAFTLGLVLGLALIIGGVGFAAWPARRRA